MGLSKSIQVGESQTGVLQEALEGFFMDTDSQMFATPQNFGIVLAAAVKISQTFFAGLQYLKLCIVFPDILGGAHPPI